MTSMAKIPPPTNSKQRAAEIAGKEAALFVPTGTMGNTIAIKLLTEHGQEVICDSRAHLLDWELSMLAWFSGCLIRSTETKDGILTWDLIQPVLKTGGPHSAPPAQSKSRTLTTWLAAASTRRKSSTTSAIVRTRAGVPVHMDGARIFNASVATGKPVREIAAKVDTVMFCLSKALGAPAGSILAGPAPLIERGRLLRKRLGGAMRQVGVLAAAGFVALEESPKCLHVDHANAQFLAHRLSQIDGVTVRPVETNIVIFDLPARCSPGATSAALKERGVLMNAVNNQFMRAVTHYDVDRQDCIEAIDALQEIVREKSSH